MTERNAARRATIADIQQESVAVLHLFVWALKSRCFFAALFFLFGFPYIVRLRLIVRNNPTAKEKTSPFLYTLR